MRTSLQMNVVWVVCLLVAVAAAPALGVTLTVDPSDWGSGGGKANYSFGALLYNVNGVQTPDVAPGTWYTWGSGGGSSLGQARVVDVGGGIYNVETRISGSDPTPAPGIIGTAGANPKITAATHAVGVSWAAAWDGSYSIDWTNYRVRHAVVNLPAATHFWGWWASGGTVGAYNLDVAGDGTVTVYNVNPDIGITGGASQLAFSDEINPVKVEVSGNPKGSGGWWSLDNAFTGSVTPSWARGFDPEYNENLYGGNYNFIGDLGSGSWLDGDNVLNVPVDATGWSETLTRISTVSGYEGRYTFTFTGPEPEPYIPEPTTMALLGLGGVGLLLRRRRSSQIKKERRIMLKAAKSLAVVAALGLLVLAAAPASAVNITVQPGAFGFGATSGQYTIHGVVWGTSGNYTFDANPNQWYGAYIQPANVGEFRVVDIGGGIYDVETRISSSDPGAAPGLSGSAGAAPTVDFVNQVVNMDRGPDWQGAWQVNWASARTSANGTGDMPALPAGQSYQGWIADSTLRGGFWFNVASDGTVTPTNTDPAGLAYTGGMNLLTMPGTQEFTWTRSGGPEPANWNWWQLDSTGVGSGKPFPESGVAYLLPNGTQGYNFIGDLGGMPWPGQLTVPMDATGWSQSLTVYDAAGNPYTWTFTGPEPEPYIPEPATMALLGIGGIGLLIRRRK